MRDAPGVLVLMFHRLREHDLKCSFDLPMRLFRDYLNVIAEGQQAICSKQVILTFDDGHISDIELALPELMHHKLEATFFIVPSLVGTEGYMTWDNILTLKRCGMTIGSHTWSHKNLALTDRQTLLRELIQSKIEIQDMIGGPVDLLALPGGFAPRAMTRYAKDVGYSHVFTSRPGIWNATSYFVPRMCVRPTLAPDQLSELMVGSLNGYYVREKMKYSVRTLLGPKLFSIAYDKWWRPRA